MQLLNTIRDSDSVVKTNTLRLSLLLKPLVTQRKYIKRMFLRLQKGFLNTSFQPIKELEDESNMEELDQPTDFKDLPVRIDWNGELPANIVVPRVDLHSLVLDFAAVSFLDISALKGLKMVNVSLTAATGAVIFPNANFFFFISFFRR